MKKILYPNKSEWAEMLRRPVLNVETLFENVGTILKEVRTNGDKAVIEYEERFDKVILESLAVSEAEIKEAEKEVPIELKVV